MRAMITIHLDTRHREEVSALVPQEHVRKLLKEEHLKAYT